jgi:ABC-type transport system substrate-binding protein
MKRNSLIAICLLIIVLFSSITFISLLTSPRTNQDAIALEPYTTTTDAIQSLMHGQIDLLPVDKIDVTTLALLQGDAKVKLVTVPTFDFTYIGLNLRNPPLNDSSLRKAMLYGFDRQSALNEALGGLGEVLPAGLFSSSYTNAGWHVYSTDPYSYNPSMAKALLDSRGYNVSSPGGFRIDPVTGRTMRTMFITSRLSEAADVAAANLFAKEMQAIGLPVVSLPQADLDFNLITRTYLFDILVDSQASDSAPVWLYNLFYSKNDVAPVPLGTNLFGYNSSAFDDSVGAFMSSTDHGVAESAVDSCQQILQNDLPVLPLFSKPILLAAASGLTVHQVVGSLMDTIRLTALNAIQSSSFPLPLRIGLTSLFDTLDPSTTSSPADWIALGLLTEPLFTYDETGNLKPDLAQQWAMNGDATRINLSLRKDVEFDTGQAITPDDFAATFGWLTSHAKASSPVYPLAREIVSADVTNQTVSISLSHPDQYVVYALADLFALPKARLSTNPSTPEFLRDQLLVSSGPFVLREFTQRQGVYLQTNPVYFGRPNQIENIYAFEGSSIIPSTSAEISSSKFMINGQLIQNGSFTVCAYDQSGFAAECAAGNQTQDAIYSATLGIDSKFHSGSYRIETSLYAVTPNGILMIFGAKEVTVIPSLILVLVIAATLIILVAAVVKRREISRLVGRRIRGKGVRQRTPRKRAARRTVAKTRKKRGVSSKAS